jgi:hypothetical protein
MHMKSEDRWHCINPACGCEALVEGSGSQEGKNPHCSCGAAMRKRYVSPALTYLEFLRIEETRKVAAHEEQNDAQFLRPPVEALLPTVAIGSR